MSRKQRRAERSIARSAKYKSEQARLAKVVEHNRAAQIDRELPGEPKIVSDLEYDDEKLRQVGAPPSPALDAMAAAIRARK